MQNRILEGLFYCCLPNRTALPENIEDRGRNLARPGAEARALFDLRVPEAIEPKRPRLTPQVIVSQQVPRRPRDEERVRLDAAVRGFSRLFHVIGLDGRLADKGDLEVAHHR